MRYLSLFSGIEAASVAWRPLGWEPFGFAEIDPFASAVLAHHYSGVPNFGSVENFKEWPAGSVDLVCGGSPCQSFSVAGLRKGMDDPRGNLALTFLAIVNRYRPKWIVYENVPGLLSSNGGRDFGSILGGMVELGYGVAYRVLDAQYVRVDGYPRAVPQRRRRVFVVGYLGDWRRAAAVLFERDGLSGNPPPRREAGERTSIGIAPSLRAQSQASHRLDSEAYVEVANRLNAKGGAGRMDGETETFIAHALRAEGFDASEDGTGRGTPLVPVAFGWQNSASQSMTADNFSPTLDKSKTVPVAFGAKDHGGDATENLAGTLRCGGKGGGPNWQGIALAAAVRRLTPRECERLQGFPDDYTAIPYRGKPAADGPRYKALGNSMACNVMRWLGYRIDAVER